MFKAILAILIEKIIEAVVKDAKDYIKLKKKRKEDKEKVDAILKGKDRKVVNQRIDDLLNS